MSSMPSGKQQPARPTISPVSSPPSRSISFASPASPPASRPMSPLTKRMSNTPSLSGLGKELEASAAPKPLWADAQEERLVYVRAELKKAQRRWSESQEIWLKEVRLLYYILSKTHPHNTLKPSKHAVIKRTHISNLIHRNMTSSNSSASTRKRLGKREQQQPRASGEAKHGAVVASAAYAPADATQAPTPPLSKHLPKKASITMTSSPIALRKMMDSQKTKIR